MAPVLFAWTPFNNPLNDPVATSPTLAKWSWVSVNTELLLRRVGNWRLTRGEWTTVHRFYHSWSAKLSATIIKSMHARLQHGAKRLEGHTWLNGRMILWIGDLKKWVWRWVWRGSVQLMAHWWWPITVFDTAVSGRNSDGAKGRNMSCQLFWRANCSGSLQFRSNLRSGSVANKLSHNLVLAEDLILAEN